MSAAMLAGCGGSSASSSAASGSAAESAAASTASAAGEVDTDVENREYKDVNIQILTRMDPSNERGKWYEQTIQDFMAKYPGITVEEINIPTESDYLDQEAVLMSDPSSMPNIIEEYGGSRVLDYINAGNLVCTQPYFDADPEWTKGFNNLGWGLVDFTDYGIEGYYGVPQNGYFINLYYNEDLLNQAGVDPASIKSWDDLMAACKTLKDAGIQPFEMGEKDNYRFGHLHTVMNYKAYGCDIATKLGKDEVAYDSEEETAIYQKIIDAVDAGYLGTNLLSTDANQEQELFNAGKAAFLFMGSWYTANAQESDLYKDQKIHALAFPYIDEQYADNDMGGGNEAYYAINTGDEDEIAASVLLLKYLTSQEVVDKRVTDYPEIMCVNPSVELSNYLLNEVNDIMSKSKIMKGDIENYDTEAHMINTVRNALQGIPTGMSAEEVGKNIVETSAQYE